MGKEKLALFGGKPVLSDPLPKYNSIGKEEIEAVNSLMKDVATGKATLSGFVGRDGPGFLGGPMVRKLEDRFEDAFGVNYAVSFNSASTALEAAIKALGIGPGDEVITTPFTMCATSTAILLAGATPVFADIDPKTFCLDPKAVREKICRRTKAIIVVNLFGGSADWDEFEKIREEYNLPIIEDNAQAPGGTYKKRLLGTFGDIGIFSFNVHKAIQCGEGGMLVTNWYDCARRAQLIRNHGEAVEADLSSEEELTLVIGNNYRLTEIQAAIVIEQLKKLNKFNQQRIELADYLTEKLKEFSWLEGVYVLSESKHVYYLYPIKFYAEKAGFSRHAFAEAMRAEGFPLNEGYHVPAHYMPVYQRRGYEKGISPVAERMWEKELLVTNLCQPPKTTKHIDLFVKALRKVEDSKEALSKTST